MTYEELKNQIRDLGFGDDDDMDDFGDAVNNKINLALSEINQLIGGIISSYEVDIYKSNYPDGFAMIDMNDADGFLELADLPIICKRVKKDGTHSEFIPFNDFDTREDGRILFINAEDCEGTLKIYYKKEHAKVTEDTDESAEIDLPKKYHILVPLLSAYYIWQEDDQTRAIYCFNRYESLANQLMAKPNRVRIKAGGL